jgi:signal transduction histidine kinase
MRSIRRSMSIYLCALLAITLITVALVIDRVTEDALSGREVDGAALIQSQYEERCRVERDKIDLSLMNEANLLFNSFNVMNDLNEGVVYRARMGSAQMMFLNNPLMEIAWTPGPMNDIVNRNYFANMPLPTEFTAHLSEINAGSDYQQINAGRSVVRGEWHSDSLAGRKLPFDREDIDAKLADHGKSVEPSVLVYDDTTLSPDNELVHRIILKVPRLPRGRGPGPFGPPPGQGGGGGPRSMLGTWSAWSLQGFQGTPPQGMASLRPERTDRQPQPAGDNLPRIYIQCARPRSIIEASLVRFAEERDAERAKLADDVAYARKKMRVQTLVVGIIALLAVAIGGPVIVGAGLRPVDKLSVAVSRVSEKDFKLPHDGQNLVQELVPIHGRLTQTLDMLQRAFTREKQAVADISHELRTPIAALMATIDVALRKQRSPEEYRSKLEECRLISKQLGELVERIMTLATLDAGNDRTTISRCDAIEICSGCTAIIRSLAAANGIAVHIHLPDEMIEIETDSGKLREVLMNLLHNAIEYNRAGGTIDLTLQREGSNAVFEVRDTGIGMTPEIKGKIFERFFRADPSRHATGVHAGLGLAIVKEYITRLNGTIDLESEPGKGSTFRIAIPALPSEMMPHVPSDEPVAAGS